MISHFKRIALTALAFIGLALWLSFALPAWGAAFPYNSTNKEPDMRLTNMPAWKVFVGIEKSVADYGAYGNASHDDTAAFQAAIETVWPGGRIVVPNGTYHISSPLRFTNQISIVGYGSNSVIKYVGTTNIPAVLIFGDDTVTLGSGNGHQHLSASDITVVGNQYCTNAVLFHFVTHSSFRNITARDALNCFRVRWGVSCTYENLLASGNEGAWGYVPDTGLRVDNNSFNVTFINPVLEAGITNGIVMDNAGGCVFIGGTAEGCTNGIVLTNGCVQNLFHGVDCELNNTSDYIIDATCNWNNIIGGQASKYTQISGSYNTITHTIHENILVTAQATNTSLGFLAYNNYTNNGVATRAVGLVDLFQKTENRSVLNQLTLSHDSTEVSSEQPLLILDPTNANRRVFYGFNQAGGYGYFGAQHVGTANLNMVMPGGNLSLGTVTAPDRLTVAGDASMAALTATNTATLHSNLLVGPNPAVARLSVSDTNHADPGSLDFVGSVLSLRKTQAGAVNYPRLDFWLNGVRGGYLGYGNSGSKVIQFVCLDGNSFNIVGDNIVNGIVTATNYYVFGQGYVFHPGNLPYTNQVTGLPAWMTNIDSRVESAGTAGNMLISDGDHWVNSAFPSFEYPLSYSVIGNQVSMPAATSLLDGYMTSNQVQLLSTASQTNHTHDASNVVSGVLADARMNAATTGTANTVAKRGASGELTAYYLAGQGGASDFPIFPAGTDSLAVAWLPGGTRMHQFHANGDAQHAGYVIGEHKSGDGTAGATNTIAVMIGITQQKDVNGFVTNVVAITTNLVYKSGLINEP